MTRDLDTFISRARPLNDFAFAGRLLGRVPFAGRLFGRVPFDGRLLVCIVSGSHLTIHLSVFFIDKAVACPFITLENLTKLSLFSALFETFVSLRAA